MAEKTFKLEVVTPDRVVFSDKTITSVVAPGSEGYVGILANHAPMIVQLGIGKLEYTQSDGTTKAIAICNGFLEVSENVVTVLSTSAELASNIDIERAKKALERAQERVASNARDVDAERARAALVRAINRLKIAGHK